MHGNMKAQYEYILQISLTYHTDLITYNNHSIYLDPFQHQLIILTSDVTELQFDPNSAWGIYNEICDFL